MTRYEVIESRVWVNKFGRVVSIHGAVPWLSETQKTGEEWRVKANGWTVYNPHNGQIGVCRPPWKTREEAEAFAANNIPPKSGIGD